MHLSIVVPLCTCVLASLFDVLRGIIYIPGLSNKAYKELGDINLGALLPVHGHDLHSFCSENLREFAVLQRMEALAFAVREINNRTDLMPDHILGFIIYDDCYKDSTALAQTLRFIRKRKLGAQESGNQSVCYNNLNNAAADCVEATVKHHDVVGVIGCEASSNTIQIANMLSAFRIPQMSYSATSPVLSNKSKYPYFQRLISSDGQQAKVIISLLRHFNWSYVSLVYAEGYYGFGGLQALKNLAHNVDPQKSICFSHILVIREQFIDSDYEAVIHKLMSSNFKATVVIVFTPLPEARQLLEAAKRLHVTGKFTWIASDSWARNMQDLWELEDAAVGMLSVNFPTATVPRFEKHFLTLNPQSHNTNPWFVDFWEAFHNCSYRFTNQDNSVRCPEHVQLLFHPIRRYKPERSIPLIIDTVYTFARAINKTLQVHCSGYQNSVIFDCVQTHLMKYLKFVTFSGQSGKVEFDKLGDRLLSYDVINFQKVRDGYELLPIAKWIPEFQSLEFTGIDIQWSGGRQPISVCSDPCPPHYQHIIHDVICCWQCEKCQDSQVSVIHNGTHKCKTCEEHTWPDQVHFTECRPMTAQYFAYKHPFGTILVFLAAIGTISTIMVAILLFRKRSSRHVNTDSRDLSYLLLTGVIVVYILIPVLMMKPTRKVCFAYLYVRSLSLTCMFGPLLSRTLHMYGMYYAIRCSWLRSSTCHVIVASGCVGIHALLLAVLNTLQPPRAQQVLWRPGLLELFCNIPLGTLISSLAYNLIILLACVFFTLRAKRSSGEVNKFGYVGPCLLCTVIVWVTFVPLYFNSTKNYVKAMLYVITSIANATVVLLFLEVPKLLFVYRKPKTSSLLHRPARERRLATVKTPERHDKGPIKDEDPVNPSTSSNALSDRFCKF